MPGPDNRRWVVSPPPPREPHKFGLLDAAAFVAEENGPNAERWLNGIRYAPVACGGGQVLPYGFTGASPHVSPFTGETNTKADGTRPAIVEADAFLVVAADTCSTLDSQNPDADYRERALATLALNEGRLAEAEFMHGAGLIAAQAAGVTGTNQWLAATATAVGPGTAVSLKYGLGLLAEAVGDDGVGMPWYHLPRRAIHSAANAIVAKFDGERGIALAYDDGILIFGEGYDNNNGAGTGSHPGPGAVTPTAGKIWVYATSPVRIWRTTDPVVTPGTYAEALVRTSGAVVNSFTFRAERGYLIDWDRCGTAAVLVDLLL